MVVKTPAPGLRPPFCLGPRAGCEVRLSGGQAPTQQVEKTTGWLGCRLCLFLRSCRFGERLPTPVYQLPSFHRGNSATFFGELQVNFEPSLQFRNDLWRPSVSGTASGLSAQFCDSPEKCSLDLFVASGHPLYEGAHGFGVKTCLRVSLTLGQFARSNNAFRQLKN